VSEVSWLEFSWLAVLLTVPLFFNVYSAAPFEAAKAHMAMLGASVTILLFCVEGRRARESATRRIGRALRSSLPSPCLGRKVCLAVIFVLLTTVVSTAISVNPVQSLVGAPYRHQGALFTLSTIAFAASIASRLRRQAQVERMMWALLAPAVFVVAYALLQARGFDFYPWHLEAITASYHLFGTLGHPSFLAVYLVMLIPLTAVESWRHRPAGWRIGVAFPSEVGKETRGWGRSDEGGGSLREAMTVRFTGSLLLLLLGSQIIVLLWTERRAGFLGLLAAGLTFALLASSHARPRKRIISLGLGAVVVLLILFAVGLTPMAGRLAHLRGGAFHTDQQRILLWETAGQILRDRPARVLVGFGPATLDQVMRGYRPPALDALVGAAPYDHTHNAAWEALLTTGLFGLLAYIGLLFAVFWTGLRALGGLPNRATRYRAVAGSTLGATVGAGALVMAGGSWSLALPGVVIGGLAGLIVVAHLSAADGGYSPASTERLRLAAGLASLTGYVVVSQFNVPDVTSTLLFWVLVALVFVLSQGLVSEQGEDCAEDGAAGAERRFLLLGTLIAITLLFDLSGAIPAHLFL